MHLPVAIDAVVALVHLGGLQFGLLVVDHLCRRRSLLLVELVVGAILTSALALALEIGWTPKWISCST